MGRVALRCSRIRRPVHRRSRWYAPTQHQDYQRRRDRCVCTDRLSQTATLVFLNDYARLFASFRAFSFARFYGRYHLASLIYRFRMVWLFDSLFCNSAISWFCGARFEYLDRDSISVVANSEAAGEAEKCVKLHRYNFETTFTRLKICVTVAWIIQSTLIVCLTRFLECDIIFLYFIILESKEGRHSPYRFGTIVEFRLRVEEAVPRPILLFVFFRLSTIFGIAS